MTWLRRPPLCPLSYEGTSLLSTYMTVDIIGPGGIEPPSAPRQGAIVPLEHGPAIRSPVTNRDLVHTRDVSFHWRPDRNRSGGENRTPVLSITSGVPVQAGPRRIRLRLYGTNALNSCYGPARIRTEAYRLFRTAISQADLRTHYGPRWIRTIGPVGPAILLGHRSVTRPHDCPCRGLLSVSAVRPSNPLGLRSMDPAGFEPAAFSLQGRRSAL